MKKGTWYVKLFFKRIQGDHKTWGQKGDRSQPFTYPPFHYVPPLLLLNAMHMHSIFFLKKHALISRPISYLALAQMQSMHSMNSFSFFSFFFLSFFFFFFPSSMHSVILNREYAMKFVMLSIFSPFTTSFKFWARFASHVISYLTDVTSVIVQGCSYSGRWWAAESTTQI